MRKEQGFTLIELLIVVAIIAIIAAIAVPNLLSARMAANEASAISGLRAIASAQMNYSVHNADLYGTMQDLTDGGYLDKRFLPGGMVNGYEFTERITPITDSAEPSRAFTNDGTNDIYGYDAKAATPNTTGRQNYVLGADFVIRYDTIHSTKNKPQCGGKDCEPGDPVGGAVGTGSGS